MDMALLGGGSSSTLVHVLDIYAVRTAFVEKLQLLGGSWRR
jgi:hypothetical protein